LSLNSCNSNWSKSLNLPEGGGDGEGVISIIRFWENGEMKRNLESLEI